MSLFITLVVVVAFSFIIGPAFVLFFEWCQELGYKHYK